MKVINSTAEMKFEVTIRLTETEARGLYDITGYGYDAFMKVFKEHLGKAYIIKNEKGVKELFECVRTELPKHFGRFDKAREVFENKKQPLIKWSNF